MSKEKRSKIILKEDVKNLTVKLNKDTVKKNKIYASKKEIREELVKSAELGKPTKNLHKLVYSIAKKYVPDMLRNSEHFIVDDQISNAYFTAVMKFRNFKMNGMITENEVINYLKIFISPVMELDKELFDILNTHFRVSWSKQIEGTAIKKINKQPVRVIMDFGSIMFNIKGDEYNRYEDIIIRVAKGETDINELHNIWQKNLLRGKKSIRRELVNNVTNNYYGSSPFSYFTEMVKNNVLMKIKKDKTYKVFGTKIHLNSDNTIVEITENEANYDIEKKKLRITKNNVY